MPSGAARPTAEVVVGAVLTGGASRRMGRDKALVEVGGRPLVAVAASALRDAGAGAVVTVGGDSAALAHAAPGTHPVADLHPGEGPLGGLLTAFAAARALTDRTATDPHADPGEGPDLIVVVLACDMPAIDGATLAALVDALRAEPTAAVAAAEVDGRAQPLTAAWRPRRAGSRLAAAFAAGERAPRRLLGDLEVVAVAGLDPHRLGDVDRPEDLGRYADAAPGPATGRGPHRPPPTVGDRHP